MIRHLRDTYARRRGEELSFESGFTLIELLIVIVVLGILAATVIFALSGVTKQSAAAACNSDAKTYEVAVSAYENAPANTGNTLPGTTNDLTGTSFGGPFLHAAANNTSYVVAIGGDSLAVPSTSGVNNTATGQAFPAGEAAGDGQVYVGTPGHALVAYDSQGSGGGCNGLS
jgi:general secretion pathway protein G